MVSERVPEGGAVLESCSGAVIQKIGGGIESFDPVCGWKGSLESRVRTTLLIVRMPCSTLPFCWEVYGQVNRS